MIRIGIIGVGNIASMLIQSIEYYKNNHGIPGIIHEIIGGYKVGDLDVVYAIDISREKVGKDISEAIFARPNITPKFVEMDKKGVIVRMGRILDGVADHMIEDFMPANEKEPSIEELVNELRDAKVDVLINLLPVGSAQASRFYAKVAAMAGVAFINSIPEFIASDKEYCKLFEENSSLILGDDIKGQLGSTIVHRTLASLISMRGGEIVESYQLNIGGNTDFKNMVDISRLTSKKISKTMAVASTQPSPEEIAEKIFAGPSGYIPFLGNTKVSYIYIKAKMFMGLPVTIDLKLTVDDKAMATPILIDAIRIAKVLKDRGIYGCPDWASAPYFKHPPRQAKSDEEALLRLYMKLENLGIEIYPKRLPILDLLSLKL
ncbi:Myo-inositol-1-phosphate synthase [Ignisphaera aggregans DSM 17230]|uniref:Myo-inositol-1-phosphate synthase n=1 Tax=Ignisphaera aggregans (strain DSM 17230 / JCM 13409 / AQ1.S1) TaxID=583356 RepID=E0SPM6_IGNAA|nr:Myo-inositol-1-phosphate synthase [Ignisphaera aggregans DSM 17230]